MFKNVTIHTDIPSYITTKTFNLQYLRLALLKLLI